MKFYSTRSRTTVSAAQAIAQGLAGDGGLFVPENFPQLPDFAELVKLDYRELAKVVLSLYLTDFSKQEISESVDAAYTGTFENDDPAPLREIAPGVNLLELWHGPTCAFKDLALQLLPQLLTRATGKTAPAGRETVILVATSGDTGKAALDGFADVPKTKIIVFYPQDGVSAMQKLQMTTQKGDNVFVCGINGNFDDAQSGVKAIFSDPEMKTSLEKKNLAFSSANSINFGRLVPQIVYYIASYCELLRRSKIKPSEKINVVVPTGNFGNILAAVYAKNMGLPVKKFICASNANNILTDFITTGVYDCNRKFFTTYSPSMDILISSNLERLLYLLLGNSPDRVAALMLELKTSGRYTIGADTLAQLQSEFAAGCCDDEETLKTIALTLKDYNYLCDPHTAVAVNVFMQYQKQTGDTAPCVIASTASPYKFAPAVLSAIAQDKEIPTDGFAALEMLSQLAGTAIPAPLAALKNAQILHPESVAKTEMKNFIRRELGL